MTAVQHEKFSDTWEFDLLTDPVRRYPVEIEVTHTYLVWVEGDDQADAVKRTDWDDASDLIRNAEPQNSDIAVRDPLGGVESETITGPPEACSECGDAQRFGADDYIRHRDRCSLFVHGESVNAVGDIADREKRWIPGCYCGWPFPGRRPSGVILTSMLPEGVEPTSLEAARAQTVEHLAPLYHFMNVRLGLEGRFPSRDAHRRLAAAGKESR